MTTIRWVHRKAQQEEKKVISLNEIKEKYSSKKKNEIDEQYYRDKEYVEKCNRNIYKGRKKANMENKKNRKYSQDELKKALRKKINEIETSSENCFYINRDGENNRDNRDNRDNIKINFDINIQFDKNSEKLGKEKKKNVENRQKEQYYTSENRQFELNKYIKENEHYRQNSLESFYSDISYEKPRYDHDGLSLHEEEKLHKYRKDNRTQFKSQEDKTHYYNSDNEYTRYYDSPYYLKEKNGTDKTGNEQKYWLYEKRDEREDSQLYNEWKKKYRSKYKHYKNNNENYNNFEEKENEEIDILKNYNRYKTKEENYNQKLREREYNNRNNKRETCDTIDQYREKYSYENSEQFYSSNFQKIESQNSFNENKNIYNTYYTNDAVNKYLMNLKNRNCIIMATNCLNEIIEIKLYSYYAVFKKKLYLKTNRFKYKKYDKLDNQNSLPFQAFQKEKKERIVCEQKEKNRHTKQNKYLDQTFSFVNNNLRNSRVNERNKTKHERTYLSNDIIETEELKKKHTSKKKENLPGYIHEILKANKNTKYENINFLKTTYKNQLLHNTLIDNFNDVNLNDQRRKKKYLKFFVILLSIFLKKYMYKHFSKFFFILGTLNQKHMEKREITKYINIRSYSLLILETLLKKKKTETLKLYFNELKTIKRNTKEQKKPTFYEDSINYSNNESKRFLNDLANSKQIKNLKTAKSFVNLCFGKPKIFYTDDFAMYFKKKHSVESEELLKNCLLRSKSDSLLYFLKFSKNELFSSTDSKNGILKNPEEDIKNSTLLEKFYTATYNQGNLYTNKDNPYNSETNNIKHISKYNYLNTLYTTNFEKASLHFSHHKYIKQVFDENEKEKLDEQIKNVYRNNSNVYYNEYYYPEEELISSHNNTNNTYISRSTISPNETQLLEECENGEGEQEKEEEERYQEDSNDEECILKMNVDETHENIQLQKDKNCRIIFKKIKKELKIKYVNKDKDKDTDTDKENINNKLCNSNLKSTINSLNDTQLDDSLQNNFHNNQ